MTSTKIFLREFFIKLSSDGVVVTFKEYKWKFVATVFAYYLVRDTFLYILLPYLSLKYFLN